MTKVTYNKTNIANDSAFLCGRLDYPIFTDVTSFIDIEFPHKIIHDIFQDIISQYNSKIKIFFAYNITPKDNYKKPSYILYKTEPYHRDRPGILEGFPKNIIENNKQSSLKNHVKKYLYDDIYNLKTNLKNYFYPFTIEVEEQPLRTNTMYFFLVIKLFFP